MPPRPTPPGRAPSFCGLRESLLTAFGALAIPGLLTTSCVSHTPKSAAPTPAVQAAVALPVETRVGVVRAVGAGQRFVLIETPSALSTATLTEGQLLHCRPPGSAESAPATADLRVSRERRQSLVVANVVAGEADVGSVVVAAPEVTPAGTPDPGSISAVSTAPLPGLFPTRKP